MLSAAPFVPSCQDPVHQSRLRLRRGRAAPIKRGAALASSGSLLQGYQGRGADELVSSPFASQTLPFKRFAPNAPITTRCSWLFSPSVSRKVCQPVVPLNCYPTTLRRRIVDVAGKIVGHARILEITAATWKLLRSTDWRKSAHPPPFACQAQKTKASRCLIRVSASASESFLPFGREITPVHPSELTRDSLPRNSHLGTFIFAKMSGIAQI